MPATPCRTSRDSGLLRALPGPGSIRGSRTDRPHAAVPRRTRCATGNPRGGLPRCRRRQDAGNRAGGQPRCLRINSSASGSPTTARARPVPGRVRRLVGRSESWVSQVERGVRPVDRMSVLQKVADVLSVSVAELRGDDEAPDLDSGPKRSTSSGLPSPVTRPSDQSSARSSSRASRQMDSLAAPARRHLGARPRQPLRRASSHPGRADPRPGDRHAHRGQRRSPQRSTRAARRHLPGHRRHDGQDRRDRRSLDRRRPGRILRRDGRSPLAVAASMFRMAHVFLSLGQIDQAHHVAASTAAALEPKVTSTAEPEVMSLYGALHLVLAVAAARDNNAAKHTSTWTLPAGSLTSSARTATTTEPNSAPPTSPSMPSASPSNSATPGRPSS